MMRQGDVLIRRATCAVPAGATPEPRDATGRLILAAGEVTGHHHAVADRTATLLPWVLDDGTAVKLLSAPDGATVKHEEHAPIVLPPGDYIVSYQREYSPEAIRRVLD